MWWIRWAPVVLAVVAAPAVGGPTWRLAGTYGTGPGPDTSVWIDTTSVQRTRGLLRVWVLTDFPDFQEGDWFAPTGQSRAYMSALELIVIDCQTKDFGYGSWHAKDGRKGTGQVIHSRNVPVPTAATVPTVPGSVGAMLAIEACRLKK